MAFKPINCPHCNEELQIPDNKERVNCMFCQEEIIVKEVLKEDTGNKLEHLFVLADSALEGDNFPEAHKYFSQILELDSTNPRAWFGKGLSSGLQSVGNINEMIIAFKNAIKFTPDDEKEAYKGFVGNTLKSVVLAAYNHEIHRVVEIAIMEGRDMLSNYSLLNYSSRSFAANGSLVIIHALEQAHEYLPSDIDVLNSIINICDNLKQAVSIRFFGFRTARTIE